MKCVVVLKFFVENKHSLEKYFQCISCSFTIIVVKDNFPKHNSIDFFLSSLSKNGNKYVTSTTF